MTAVAATAETTPTVAHGLPGPSKAVEIETARLAALRSVLEESRRERRALLQSLTAEDLHTLETDPAAAAQVSAARRTVQETEAALARMDDGSFGVCVHCGQPIQWARLEFLPHASGCVPCTQRINDRR